LKIKEAFPSLQNKKIKLIQKIISGEGKLKPCINITIKGPSRKQVIVSMSIDNANINKTLKNIKSDIIADFIHVENKGVVISINKVTSPLDLQSIKKYIKNAHYIEVDQMEPLRLSQSKLYLKIIGILYLFEQTNACITSDDIKKILKNNHIFNNIVLASKPRVIKVSPKSDIAIVWINIWDAQSGMMLGIVHTGVEVCRMDSELSRLVERPWLQLMCCTVCLPHGCNFR